MKNTRKDCDKSCFMCTLCLPEWIPAIMTNRTVRHFKKGQLIFKEGLEVQEMYFINKGAVKVHKKWGDDKELIVRVAGDGDILGHRGMGADSVYPASGTALEPVSVCCISIDFFTTTLKVNHQFLYELMLFFAAELKISERKMRSLAHMPVKNRLAEILQRLFQKFGITETGAIALSMSRQDLASCVGTTYETIFRTLQEMVEENLIQLNGKEIILTDQEKLWQLTQKPG